MGRPNRGTRSLAAGRRGTRGAHAPPCSLASPRAPPRSRRSSVPPPLLHLWAAVVFTSSSPLPPFPAISSAPSETDTLQRTEPNPTAPGPNQRGSGGESSGESRGKGSDKTSGSGAGRALSRVFASLRLTPREPDFFFLAPRGACTCVGDLMDESFVSSPLGSVDIVSTACLVQLG